MIEIMAIWGQWLKPSAGLPTVQWSLLLALAAAAGHLVQRHIGLPKVVGYSAVGAIAGLAGFAGVGLAAAGRRPVPAGAGRVDRAVRDRRAHRAALVPPQPDGAAAKHAGGGAHLRRRLLRRCAGSTCAPSVADALALIAIASSPGRAQPRGRGHPRRRAGHRTRPGARHPQRPLRADAGRARASACCSARRPTGCDLLLPGGGGAGPLGRGRRGAGAGAALGAARDEPDQREHLDPADRR